MLYTNPMHFVYLHSSHLVPVRSRAVLRFRTRTIVRKKLLFCVSRTGTLVNIVFHVPGFVHIGLYRGTRSVGVGVRRHSWDDIWHVELSKFEWVSLN